MTSAFSDSVDNAKTTLECWKKVIAFLQNAEGPNGEKFNQEAEVPGTGQELWWFDKRAIAASNLVKSLEQVVVDSDAAIPLEFIAELELASQQFKKIVLSIAGSIEKVDDKGIGHLDPSTWEVVVNETNANYNFASHLQNFQKIAEYLLTVYYKVAPIVGAGKFDAFVEAVRDFSDKAASVREDIDAVSAAKESAQNDASVTSGKKDQVEKNRVKIAEILKTTQKYLSEIGEVSQSNLSTLEQVSEISNSANTLNSQVNGYKKTFDVFQRALSDRNSAFVEWSKNVEALYGGLKEKDEQIGDVIRKSEEMLAGATNAGLASTFKLTLSDLDEKLKWAQRSFYWSIFLLFISALPLALYLAPVTGSFEPDSDAAIGLWGNLGPFSNGNGLSLTNTIALFLLMVPTVWLSKFSAARHHQLFQLKEHYQYKYSLAMAVEGFKKQAPEHADAIAAETFNRLLFNPADRLEGKGGSDDHPSPLMNWLMNKFGFNSKGKSNV